ncbi:signal peptide peptidase SppA [Abyssalbus ytuae]|uniref:Signal peptide peptidase SppA n=1 Tax=Abyssalbus ytuae TaxID=2926907 RepID=A0A9E6ZR20_9FLAO|nr:signal peptide peptidase SppA [Abyssalbus ytuae]UOB18920.1 signal peptide peptidase SppA [Abyssalbus ytuae]
MRFLRNLLASILGTLIALGIIFMLFLIFVAIVAGSKEEIIRVKNNSVLDLKLTEPLKDYGGKFNFVDFDYKYEEYNGLNSILRAIHYARNDNKIKGITINSTFLTNGTAQIKALRDALKEFKSSGKFVYAYGDYFMQKDYYLASVADSVFLNPVGEMDYRGLSSEVLFFKDLQEKTGFKMEVIRHGKYKSAVEPFLNNEMSKENREQISELLNSIWHSVLNDISESRNISVARLNMMADSLAARTPKLASSNGLIDGLKYFDEYESLIRSAMEVEEDKEINYVDIYEYSEYVSKKRISYGDKIAVIYAEGEIQYGKGNEEFVGQGVISDALRDAANNDEVKAVVLRVNSPGGSALASDIIWREVEMAKKIKPVIVSMGNLAASGGYYISAGANRIFAEPSTITGSIGVFGVVPNVSVLADKWGINAEQVNTNKNSTLYSVFEPVTKEFRDYASESIEEVYQTFIHKVANGRNIPVARVDSIAQGRVWSGEQAQKIGLVDEIGGLDSAVAYAAGLTEVSDYSIKEYPVFEQSLEEILGAIPGVKSSQVKEKIIKEEIGEEAYEMLKGVNKFTKLKGVQARLPFEINIK